MEWKASFEQKCGIACDYYMDLYRCLSASTLAHHGQEGLRRMHWQMVRRHHREFFLPGLKKLGLEHEASDAIAAAKYHVFANMVVDIDYVEESPEKVWLRYNPPSQYGGLVGTFSAAVGAGDYAAWNAYNGPAMGNPRLGYVVTHLICQGDPYDAGYFKLYDHDLAHPEETFQLSPGERVPPVDPEKAPKLPGDWTRERELRALRNSAVEGAYQVIYTLLDLHGVGGARALLAQAASVTATLQYRPLIEALEIERFDAAGVAEFIRRDRALLDEEVSVEEVSSDECVVRQTARNPRFFPDPARVPVEIDEALLAGWRTLIELMNRDLTVDMTAALSAGDPHHEWVIRRRLD